LDDLKEARRYWKLKEIALFGELSLEEAMDLSPDRLLIDKKNNICLERLGKTMEVLLESKCF
jgi:hypothetical protein